MSKGNREDRVKCPLLIAKSLMTIENMKRTETDICFLCKKNEANQTNSHLVPAGMIKSMVGKRNYEESYLIDTRLPKTDVFYGRSNLKNTAPELKQNHHTRDYWFCSHCEKRLSVVENECLPILFGEIRDPKKKQKFVEGRTERNIEFKDVKNLDKRVFQLFICSVIWRVALKYRLEDEIIVFSPEPEEKLRVLLDKHLSVNINEIKEIHSEFDEPLFITLTAEDFDEASKNFVVTEEKLIDPNVFFLNEFIIIYFPGSFENSLGEDDLKLGLEIEDPELLSSNSENPRIGFVSAKKWGEILKSITDLIAKLFWARMTGQVMEASGFSFEECKLMITINAEKLESETDDSYTVCCIRATELLVEAYEEMKNKAK